MSDDENDTKAGKEKHLHEISLPFEKSNPTQKKKRLKGINKKAARMSLRETIISKLGVK